LISSGWPLAQHCCISKPHGLAGLPAPVELPHRHAGRRWNAAHDTGGTLDQRAHAAVLACTGEAGNEIGGGAMAEGMWHGGMNSSGAQTSARQPHR
jgi:hypothetical protein